MPPAIARFNGTFGEFSVILKWYRYILYIKQIADAPDDVTSPLHVCFVSHNICVVSLQASIDSQEISLAAGPTRESLHRLTSGKIRKSPCDNLSAKTTIARVNVSQLTKS